MIECSLLDYSDILKNEMRSKKCRHDRDWKDIEFWNSGENSSKNICDTVCNLDHTNTSLLNQINKVGEKANILVSTKKVNQDKKILRIYFNKWQLHSLKMKESKISKGIDTQQKEKLKLLMKNLSKYQNMQKQQIQKCKYVISDIDQKEANTQTVLRKQDIVMNRPVAEHVKEHSSFENRFKAKDSIIEKQKLRLAEQEKIIQELKLGIIKEDLMKSISNSKIDIQEIFKKCSAKVKYTVMPRSEYVEDMREMFMLKAQKAPKVLQQMEQRAIERALKREIILKRRHLIEEEKKRLAEEAIEKKRIQDEEERKRNLEIIKQRRMKELKLGKLKQIREQKFLEKLNIATQCHTKGVMRKCFCSWKQSWLKAKCNMVKSEEVYNSRILVGVMKKWYEIIERKYSAKYFVADAVYNKKLLKYAFTSWKKTYKEYICSLQVAEDFYDLCLQTNVFVHWYRYVCTEIIASEKKILKANNHYKKWVLFHYFCQWKSLPTVLQLEKAKEENKRKWREKVWEILPDYKPPDEESYL